MTIGQRSTLSGDPVAVPGLERAVPDLSIAATDRPLRLDQYVYVETHAWWLTTHGPHQLLAEHRLRQWVPADADARGCWSARSPERRSGSTARPRPPSPTATTCAPRSRSAGSARRTAPSTSTSTNPTTGPALGRGAFGGAGR